MFGIYLKSNLYPVVKPQYKSLAEAEVALIRIGDWICIDTLEIADHREIEYRHYLAECAATTVTDKPRLEVVR